LPITWSYPWFSSAMTMTLRPPAEDGAVVVGAVVAGAVVAGVVGWVQQAPVLPQAPTTSAARARIAGSQHEEGGIRVRTRASCSPVGEKTLKRSSGNSYRRPVTVPRMTRSTPAAPALAARPIPAGLSKVPQVTALFWIIKVLTTGMGETASDFLAHTVAPPVAVGLGAAGLTVALVLQFRVRRYLAGVYWSAVIMVSVFGTMAADVLHVGLGVPYQVSTTGFAVVLALILGLWYASERTLSIHSITTGRREFFYWATVLATFALGTALGDLTAATLGWGYLVSGLVFAAAITVPALAHRTGRLGGVAAFWTAYVITRPLGASFADWMGVSTARGGLGWGTGPVTLAWAAVIVVLVAYLAVSHADAEFDFSTEP
jgi:uncharacterized membrane-anchored protein